MPEQFLTSPACGRLTCSKHYRLAANLIIDEAFDLLGDDIILAHAKDLDRDGEAGHKAAGTGLLDYDQYLSLLNAVGFDVPLILHGLSEAQVDECVAFLRGKIAAIK